MPRLDSRTNDEPRKTDIVPGYLSFAEGSALIKAGNTHVICAATVEERVPPFLRGQRKGWVTAEYSMLPRSTLSRTSRKRASGQNNGRAQEIQRLIGRALRSVTDLDGLGERTIILDCDVLQADGGTRTAAITGAYVALYQALLGLKRQEIISSLPLHGSVAATSVGLVDETPLLDLSYEEDFRASVDFNVAMTNTGKFVEVQGTAEGDPFSQEAMDTLLGLARQGIRYLFDAQQQAIQTM